MGRAQKLKQQRREEEKKKEVEKKEKRKRKYIKYGLVVLIVMLLGSGGYLLYKWQDSIYEYREMVLETEKGTVKIELLQDNAPETTARIAELAEQGFYDGTYFHRVLVSIVQGGCPNTLNDDPADDGMGGSGITFANEINPFSPGFADDINEYFENREMSLFDALEQVMMAEHGLDKEYIDMELEQAGETRESLERQYEERQLNYNEVILNMYAGMEYEFTGTVDSAVMENGSVAMANSGPVNMQTGEPGTNDSQFFIIRDYDKDDLMLLLWRYKHTVFGKVVEGMEIVNDIEKEDIINKAYINEEKRRR